MTKANPCYENTPLICLLVVPDLSGVVRKTNPIKKGGSLPKKTKKQKKVDKTTKGIL